jgi:hypothetical protein
MLIPVYACFTFGGRWPGIACVAFMAGLFANPPVSARVNAALAGTAWGGILLVTWLRGFPIGVVATTVSSVMSIPPAALVVATLLFAAAIAWCATTIGASLRILYRCESARSRHL